MRSTSPVHLLIVLLIAMLLSACASTPAEKPEDALSTAQYAITQAHQKIGRASQSVPLYEAEKRLEKARRLVDKPDATAKDYVRARRLAEQATLDAHLAEAQADAKQAQARESEVQESLETLREEMQRGEAE